MQRRALLLAAMLVGVLAAWGFAQESQSNMPDMMKMQEQMMAQMRTNEVKLDALVAQMNTATGSAKVDAAAAVVTELVRQQKAMHEHMGHMHAMMARGMMGGRGMMRAQ